MDMYKENWSPIRFRCQILHNRVEALEASAQVALTCQWCGMLAPEIPPDQRLLSVDDLADQVAEVLDFFG